MSMRQKVREFLDERGSPAWACEIIAAVAAQGIECKPARISAMVNDGALVKHDTSPPSYSVGRRPVVMTEEERIAARRATEAKRAKVRNVKRKEERRARGIQPRPPRRPKVEIVVAKQATGQTVEEFLRNGGKVERLPGFQFDGTYQPRRPITGPGVRVSA